ncbi:MAG: DNA gyrase inhibitor YacG [Caulobacterales bacterium]|nr:DNA gyrase inhibitor YacG [Caulobacterales bacterium]
MSCPVCSEPSAAAYRPFCSKRCADVDLGRWLKGSYVVPGLDGEAADDAPPGDGAPSSDAPAPGEEA